MTFVPTEHLMKVKGGALYMQVRDRLIWFREQHPNGHIVTELVFADYDKGLYVMRAAVNVPDGGSATGFKSETDRDFPAGALEKAETGAIGRALAALGFGTAFAQEMDEGDRVADAPSQARTVAWVGRTAAADSAEVTALRAEVSRMLDLDAVAFAKLPKTAEQMTIEELRKTLNWLRARATRPDVKVVVGKEAEPTGGRVEPSKHEASADKARGEDDIEPLFESAYEPTREVEEAVDNAALVAQFGERIKVAKDEKAINAVLDEANDARKATVISRDDYQNLLNEAKAKIMSLIAASGAPKQQQGRR